MAQHAKYQTKDRIIERGDDIEQHWAQRILCRIPNYAVIWELYVGNDGHEVMLEMPGASAAAIAERKKLWERLYTIFESLALSWSLEEQLIERLEISTYEEYAENLNYWMAFYANLGRIHDMAGKVADQVANGGMVKDLYQFYEQRNIALHGHKVPMKWVGNMLAAPELGEMRGHWNDKKMRWEDLDNAEYKVLADQMTRACIQTR